MVHTRLHPTIPSPAYLTYLVTTEVACPPSMEEPCRYKDVLSDPVTTLLARIMDHYSLQGNGTHLGELSRLEYQTG